MIIREMLPSDWQRVAEIYREGIETNNATFQNEVPSYAQWDSSHYSHCRLVAQIDDWVIGWVALTPTSERAVFSGVAEVSIYVDASYRGKGVGTALLSQLSAVSEQHGIWCLESRIFQDNQASVALHEHCGFRFVGIRERLGFDSKVDRWRNVVLMERRSQVVG